MKLDRSWFAERSFERKMAKKISERILAGMKSAAFATNGSQLKKVEASS